MRRALAFVVMVLAIMIIAVSCEDHVHTYSDDWTSDETSHWHAATCEHTTEVKDKASHVWGEYVIDKDSTETEKGSKHRVCSVCGYTETSVIAEKEHEHALVYRYNNSSHWQVCTKCNEKFDSYSHSLSYRDAGDSGHYKKCYCGYSTSVVAHTYGAEEASAAGGTVKTCSACGHKDILTKQAETTTTVSDIIKNAGVTEDKATDESGNQIAVKKTNNIVDMTAEVIATETAPTLTDGKTATTTVSFPTGALKIKEDAEEVKLTVITAPATVASLNSSGYQITTSGGTEGQQETKTDTTQAVVAGFEFNLEGAVASDLTGTKTEGQKTENVGTTITTYIAAGLGEYAKGDTTKQPIKIKYIDSNGKVDENSTPTIESYDNSDGKLVFTVYHFSKYIVISEKKFVTDNKGNMYETLKAAIDDTNGGNTITLLADVELTEDITANRSVTLNLNGKNVKGSNETISVSSGKVVTITNSVSGQNALISTGVKVGAAKAVDGVYYPTIQEAVGKVTGDTTVVLLNDITAVSAPIEINRPITLDFNGKKVASECSRIFLVHKGTLTIKNGTVEAKVYTDSKKTSEDIGSSVVRIDCSEGNAGVVLASDAKIIADNCYGITAFGTSNNATIDVYGKIKSANPCLGGNGSEDYFGCKVTINVYAGAELTQENPASGWTIGTENDDPVAIYQPNGGVLNIYGGTITSKNGSAVEIRAGEANISGGTLASEADFNVKANGNGPTVKGVAVAVSQHTTKKPVTVTISGGTFTCSDKGAQLAVVNPENNPVENTKDVKVVLKTGVSMSSDKIVGTKAGYSTDVNGVYYVDCESAKADGVSSSKIIHYIDGKCGGCGNYYYNSIASMNTYAKRDDILNNTVTVTVGTQKFDSEADNFNIGTETLKGTSGDSGKTTFIFKDGDITTNATDYWTIDNKDNQGHDGNKGTHIVILVPEGSDVIFENVDFHGVVCFGGTFNSLTLKNCKFEGTVLGYVKIVDITFDGCTFNTYFSNNVPKSSNPIWLRPSGGKYMHTFTFINNTVYGCLPVKLERVGVDQGTVTYTPVIKVLDNYFDVSYDYKGTGEKFNGNRKMGFMIRPNGENNTESDQTKDKNVYFTLYDDGNTKSDGTTAIYVVDDDQTECFDTKGIKILDRYGNNKEIQALVLKSTDTWITLKTIE